MVLWWIAAGHIPSLDEAKARLQELRTNGESDRAFTYRKPLFAAGRHRHGGTEPQSTSDAVNPARLCVSGSPWHSVRLRGRPLPNFSQRRDQLIDLPG